MILVFITNDKEYSIHLYKIINSVKNNELLANIITICNKLYHIASLPMPPVISLFTKKKTHFKLCFLKSPKCACFFITCKTLKFLAPH